MFPDPRKMPVVTGNDASSSSSAPLPGDDAINHGGELPTNEDGDGTGGVNPGPDVSDESRPQVDPTRNYWTETDTHFIFHKIKPAMKMVKPFGHVRVQGGPEPG